MIICDRIDLLKQWCGAIEKFTSATFQYIEPSDTLTPNIDFYLMNALNVSKVPRITYKNIGLVIVDECHSIMAEQISKCMTYLFPRYVIGLSATAYRPDSLDKLFDFYFGTNKVYRKLEREHIVYKINTGLTPTVQFNGNGIIWDSVLSFQSEDVQRNEMIINIIKEYRDRVFLVLCPRVIQSTYLVRRLQEEHESVTSFVGSQRTYDETARIIIATDKKCGKGFDHPRLNALILGTDMCGADPEKNEGTKEGYFIQIIGRIFRTPDNAIIPIVFDLVDNHSLLEKHFKVREAVYLEAKGRITVH